MRLLGGGTAARRSLVILAELAWLLGGAALAATRAHAAGPWSAERVLEAVRRSDPEVRAAHAGGRAGRARAAGSWATLAPRLTASVGFTRSDDPALLFSQKLWQGRFTPADFAIDRLNQPPAQSALQVGLVLDQAIWSGGRQLTAPGLASRRARAATAMEHAEVATRLLAAVEAWVDALAARERSQAADQALTAALAMRDDSVERWRLGQVPELDTLRAAARLGESRVRAIGARRDAAVRLERLSRIVGEPVAGADLVADSESPPPPDRPAERGELTAARETAAAEGAEALGAGLDLLPSLHSRLAVNQYRPAESGDFERRWMVAVSAELPLFDGGQRWNEWRAARARAAEARARADALARDFAIGVDAARAEDAVALERRDAARAGRAAAEEALRLAGHRYRSGLLPLTELLATDAEATAARSAEVEATAAVHLARYQLLHAMGELK